MLNDIEMKPESTPAVPAPTCACGSGLPAVACCSLDLNRVRPATPTEENRARLAALTEARQRADQEAATELSLTILTEQPTLLKALSMLFLIRKDQGKHSAALALIRRAATLVPREARYTKYLVDELIIDKQWRQAEAAARRAVRLNPGQPLAHALLGEVFASTQRPADAEFHFRQVLALGDARGPETLLPLADVLRAQGKFDEARALYEEMRALAPNHAGALLGLVETEAAAGDFARAEERLADAESKIRAPLRLARLKARIAFDAGRAEDALRVLQAGFPSPEAYAVPDHYLLGQILDRLARYEEAFTAFRAANDRHLTYAGTAFELSRFSGAARAARVFGRDDGKNGLPPIAVAPGPQPLFIVGSPRSGTTMLEQSLSMHPNIVAGGELSSLTKTAGASGRLLGSPSRYPLSLAELWMGDEQDQVSLLRDHYLNSAKRDLRGTSVDWFTDKALTHELYLGFAHLLFPESPIIRIVRHPLDIVVSNYANGLPHGGFSGGVKEAAEYCRLLLETAEDTRQRNPDIKILQVRYEDILEDQEGWTRKILDFVGEPYDEACLRFHENKRYGRTVSYQQVREKVNNKSKYRYRNYLKHLGPAIEVLQSEISRLGYEI